MKTLNVNKMTSVNAGMSNEVGHAICVGVMGITTGIWATAAGMVSLGAGFALGFVGGYFSDWVCSHI